MKRGGLLKLFHIRKGMTVSKTGKYSKEQYKKLSTNAKEKLWKLCEGLPQDGRPREGGEKVIERHKNIRKLEKKAKKLQITINKLEAKRVDEDNKSNSSDSDALIANATAGTNRNHPALTRQANDKG